MNVPLLTAAAPDLLHIVGYLTGATLFAMLLAMVLRAGRPDRLMVVTAASGLAWNVGELSGQTLRRFAVAGVDRWLEAASYSALGLLAAVVVHSVTSRSDSRDSRVRRHLGRALPFVAYATAAAAAGLHFRGVAAGSMAPSRAALLVLTIGFIALIPALVLTTLTQPHSRRGLWMTALAVFAVSAQHLGSPHTQSESWVLELVGHHASIPLAFAILYEDYRFALADLFLKHALTLIALVTVVFGAWNLVMPTPAAGQDRTAAVLALWVATALLFPWLRRGVAAFVDRFVLQRDDYAVLLERCAATLEAHDTEDALLNATCGLLRPALSATAVAWSPTDIARSPTASSSVRHEIVVQTTDAPQYVLAVGPLAGGRRMLSDDVAMLERVAAMVARRIDALRLTDERYERMLREREMHTLATEAELRALRSQVNPHFLFNALTTIGYLIQHAPPRALDTLMELTTLLRGVLRSEGEFTTLRHERDIIESYLRIEAERFQERLVVDIDIPDSLNQRLIPALIVQPLVENAIKHGVAKSRGGGTVRVQARAHHGGEGDAGLCITVLNTGTPLEYPIPRDGVGLTNVTRRLEWYYGDAATLVLQADPDGSTVAQLTLPAGRSDAPHAVTVPTRQRRA